MGVGAPRHGYHFWKGEYVWRLWVIYICQCGGAAAARYELMLVNAGIQKLLGGGSVLAQAELMNPCPQVVPVVEAES